MWQSLIIIGWRILKDSYLVVTKQTGQLYKDFLAFNKDT